MQQTSDLDSTILRLLGQLKGCVAPLAGHYCPSQNCGCSSVGRAPPCQGGRREFEPRHPLLTSLVLNSALQVMGKDELKVIATELVTQVRKSVTIDWTLRESARAKIKVLVKHILRKHGYPPDLQDEATKLVLQQAELLCAEWAA